MREQQGTSKVFLSIFFHPKDPVQEDLALGIQEDLVRNQALNHDIAGTVIFQVLNTSP